MTNDNPTHSWWFIHRHCFERRPLMGPGDFVVEDVCGGVLARAALQHGVSLYGYAFFPTRMFLIVGAPLEDIAPFKQFLFANLSKRLLPLRPRWKGSFWEPRATCIGIDPWHLDQHLDAARLVKRKAFLHFDEQLQRGEPRTFSWFATPGRYEDASALKIKLRLAKPPGQGSVVLAAF